MDERTSIQVIDYGVLLLMWDIIIITQTNKEIAVNWFKAPSFLFDVEV